VTDYAGYVTSFLQIRDDRIADHVRASIENGLLWPPPRIQLNPAFESGGTIDELVGRGLLHEECRRIFRVRKDAIPGGEPMRLHRHQADALEAARSGQSYVLTTGTGSGKSLAYIVPIVDWVLRRGGGGGIQAVVVYPMNALANSQLGELEKFLAHGYSDRRGPVSYARYTGQESTEEREAVLRDPPDILLTNYVMLELLLTRPFERNLVAAARGLRFLVLDELHTYRGRQGADVALLVRRAREAFQAQELQCVGTSATLAGEGTVDEQRAQVATVASRLFGTQVRPDNVIGETLRRATGDADDLAPELLRARLTPASEPPSAHDDFVHDPLARWIEGTFGLAREPAEGRLVRSTPLPIAGAEGGAKRLAQLTGSPVAVCEDSLQRYLLAGGAVRDPDTGFPVFAFRLHQFISRGETAHATLEHEAVRHITVEGQQWAPGRTRPLYPLVFCRECGQEYYSVRMPDPDDGGVRALLPRDPSNRQDDDDGHAGFVYLSTERPWPTDPVELINRLPDEWIDSSRGALRVASASQRHLPRPLRLTPTGHEDEAGLEAHFLPSPFRICVACGVSYSGRLGSDFARLATLGSEGRSTATTVMSLSLIRGLRSDATLPERARKLLSFTDNRQDASLQAGHFNDFIEVGLLRSALYRATRDAGANGLAYDELAAAVFDALALPVRLYAADPEVRFGALEETHRALRDVIGYRLYVDLRRGWRITSPNLEQCGLLEIGYVSLEELCAAEDVWSGAHPALAGARPETRAAVARVLLDHMRRDLAIRVDYLDAEHQERIRQRSSAVLAGRWALGEEEDLLSAKVLYPRSRHAGRRDYGGHVYLSPRTGFGRLLRRNETFPNHASELSLEEAGRINRDLLAALQVGGLVAQVDPGGDGIPGYQLAASQMRWRAGDGERGIDDPIRIPNAPEAGRRVNPFLRDFYREVAAETIDLEGREHTAQVDAAIRIEREEAFREGRLPVLYCSPTMELGVDIAELNAVNLRNVPPTPANYAQRSGRAGRSGQAALVVTYCSTGSPHDQYFFRRPERMVSGQVAPPRLDLGNEDLVRAHVHAIWLAETGAALGRSLAEVLDLSDPELPILPSLRNDLADPGARARATARADRVLTTLGDQLLDADWYSDGWLETTLEAAERRFDRACDRWRELYGAAVRQQEAQNRIVNDHSRTPEDRRRARRLRAEAEAQRDLLIATEERAMEADFYSYRYLASEGFLPGYSFPRLPLSAFIPGRRPGGRRGEDGFISRPRFLAISEFGPRSVIYHEGSRYQVNKVILPVAERTDEEGVPLQAMKLCASCGYSHLAAASGPDLCERCGAELPDAIDRLLRLQNVATRRRERITSDEEERLRQGFDMATGVRFAEHEGTPSVRRADVAADGAPLLALEYGAAATLWRINLGWARRRNRAQLGFVLDTERGYWARNEASADDPEDPMSPRTARVIPFVEDRRNCLLIEPARPPSLEEALSLRAALKIGAQVAFQLEDSELGLDVLPSEGPPRVLLFFESAEGGAGVLRRLVDDPDALPRVAREALTLAHFDPDTGEDLGSAPTASEPCEAACYDCLMSYANQRDHRKLDRFSVRDLLLALSRATVTVSPVARSRLEHLERLMREAGSELERAFLRLLERRGHRLPAASQRLVAGCATRPDFLYEDASVAVYVDGPHHRFPERRARDADQGHCLEDQGYRVLRFGSEEDEPEAAWRTLLDMHPDVFGVANEPSAAMPSSEDEDELDLDLFDRRWQPLVRALSRDAGTVVEPGADAAAADGAVVGVYRAAVLRDGRRLVLIDVADPAAEQIEAAVAERGEAALRVAPEPVDQALTAVEAALGGPR
jgi:superfamily II DNA/RNA helicase/very-short-patch-repair endonuclease